MRTVANFFAEITTLPLVVFLTDSFLQVVVQYKSESSINHYPRHVGDIIRATVGLSLAERGAYDALLDQYYATEKALPLDPKERYRMAAAVGKLERAAVDYVVKRYFTEEADGWHQKRTDEEISAYRTRAESARENGQRGGRPSNRMQTDPVIAGLAKQTESKANQEPVTSNQEPRGKTKSPRTRATQLPHDFAVSDRVREWAADKGYDRLEQRLEHFRDKALQKGYANHDWDLAFMNAIREGWAKPDPLTANGLSPAGESSRKGIERWIESEEAKDAAH